MQILIKEPDNIDNYYPFSETHCIWELRSGALRLFEKIINLFENSNIVLSARDPQLQVFLRRENEANIYNSIANNSSSSNIDTTNNINSIPILEITSSFIFDLHVKSQIMSAIEKFPNTNLIFVFNNNTLVKYIYNTQNIEHLTIELKNINLINYLWEILDFQAEQIILDAELLFSKTHKSLKALNHNSKNFNFKINNSNLINSSNIFVGQNVKISPSAVLDASSGCIIIDHNAELMHNSVIIGPCYIGENTTIKLGATIYENCSFGKFCKIGGELENTIFHNFSNKQHSGFIGNSYIGEWVNLGANTNNSDLKNNYSEISMYLPSATNHKIINTKKTFLGFICGDHTKTAINSSISTGSVFGTAVMLASSNFSPKLIKSFSWLTDEVSGRYNFDDFVHTMKIVKARRKQEVFPEEIKIMSQIADQNNV